MIESLSLANNVLAPQPELSWDEVDRVIELVLGARLLLVDRTDPCDGDEERDGMWWELLPGEPGPDSSRSKSRIDGACIESAKYPGRTLRIALRGCGCGCGCKPVSSLSTVSALCCWIYKTDKRIEKV